MQYVPLNDLVSACTITKCISLLAAPVLHEHRRLQDHYSVIYSAGAEDHPLARLLIRFFADPRIAHHIRSLTLVGWMDEWELDDDGRSPAPSQAQMDQYKSKDMQLFRTAEILPASIRILRLMIAVETAVERSVSEIDASRKLERILEAILSILEVKNVLLPQLAEIHVVTNLKVRSSVFFG